MLNDLGTRVQLERAGCPGNTSPTATHRTQVNTVLMTPSVAVTSPTHTAHTETTIMTQPTNQ